MGKKERNVLEHLVLIGHVDPVETRTDRVSHQPPGLVWLGLPWSKLPVRLALTIIIISWMSQRSAIRTDAYLLRSSKVFTCPPPPLKLFPPLSFFSFPRCFLPWTFDLWPVIVRDRHGLCPLDKFALVDSPSRFFVLGLSTFTSSASNKLFQRGSLSNCPATVCPHRHIYQDGSATPCLGRQAGRRV